MSEENKKKYGDICIVNIVQICIVNSMNIKKKKRKNKEVFFMFIEKSIAFKMQIALDFIHLAPLVCIIC